MLTIKILMIIIFGLFALVATMIASKTFKEEGFSVKFFIQLFGLFMGVLMFIFSIVYM